MVRVLSAIVLLPAVFAAVWFLDTAGLLIVVEAILILAMLEYARLSAGLGADLPVVPATVAAGLTCAAVAWPGGPVEVAWMAGTLALASISVGWGRVASTTLTSVFSAAFAMAYVGLPLGCLVRIHRLDGPGAVLALLLTVAASDTAQYYTGRLLGRHKLSPAISPNKTVEGAIGGLTFGTLAMVLLGAWWRPEAGALGMAGLGLVAVSLGILGDLFESLLKRSAGVKDSSNLIPGHGGVLDRIDALLFAAPCYYLALTYGVF
ncbi:MAG: phosphatidate cytidylyltransferase [Vicinamibacterales bacterium]